MGKLKYKELKNDYPELHGYFCFLTEEEIVKENLESYQILAEACDHVSLAKLIHHNKKAIEYDFVMKKRARIAYEASTGDEKAKGKRRLINAAEEGTKNPFPWCPTKITPEFNTLIREFAYVVMELQNIRKKLE